MVATIKKVTTNLGMRIPIFDTAGWGREIERNFDVLDAAITVATGISNVVGVWSNNTAYTAGQRTVDEIDATLYECVVSHTSASSGTFSADRASNPTFWSAITTAVNYRGAWVTGTVYNINDVVFTDQHYAIASTPFTSGASLAADVGAGNFETIVNFTVEYADILAKQILAAANQTAAETAQTAAELAETNAETAQGLSEAAQTASETAQGLSETAQAASELAKTGAETAETNAETAQGLAETARVGAELAETNAETAETNAGVSAAAALVSENNAATSEANANIILASAVRGDIVQSLTEAEQGQARANIGADILGGFRNKIINGNFDIWQRGTSHTALAYLADRWLDVHSGSTHTASRQDFALGQTAVPGNPKYFHRTVVSSVAGAGNYAAAQHPVEGVETLSGGKATITFWAKADASKNIAAELRQTFGSGGSPSASDGIGAQKFALTTSWQKFTAVVDVPSVSGKTLGSNNNDALYLVLWLDAGSTLNARTDSLGQQSGTFDIARVSLVEGDATAEADPFSPRHIQQELALCQRYFEIGFAQMTAYQLSGTGFGYGHSFNVRKRIVPNMSFANQVYINASAFMSGGTYTTGYIMNGAATTTGLIRAGGTFYADAEL